jgi:hypothetical protein
MRCRTSNFYKLDCTIIVGMITTCVSLIVMLLVTKTLIIPHPT